MKTKLTRSLKKLIYIPYKIQEKEKPELNHHAKDFLSTESVLMNGTIHIPVNLIQMSWRPSLIAAMHCGLVLGLSCVKGLIFSPSKRHTYCGHFTIWYMDWEREKNLCMKLKNIPLLTPPYHDILLMQRLLKRCYYPPSMSDFYLTLKVLVFCP